MKQLKFGTYPFQKINLLLTIKLLFYDLSLQAHYLVKSDDQHFWCSLVGTGTEAILCEILFCRLCCSDILNGFFPFACASFSLSSAWPFPNPANSIRARRHPNIPFNHVSVLVPKLPINRSCAVLLPKITRAFWLPVGYECEWTKEPIRIQKVEWNTFLNKDSYFNHLQFVWSFIDHEKETGRVCFMR